MKDWYFRRQLKSSNACVGLHTTRISDFVFRRRCCRFPNSLLHGEGGGGGGSIERRKHVYMISDQGIFAMIVHLIK